MPRILIVSDARWYSEGLEAVLARYEDAVVVGRASTGAEGVDQLARLRPVVVLLDASMPASLSVARTICEGAPDTPLVAVGLSGGDAEITAWAEAGAAGAVPREASSADLVAAIRNAEQGELVWSPRVAAALLRSFAHRRQASSLHPEGTEPIRLTRREMEVLHLLEDGLSNKEIAVRLGIEVATVKNHVHNLFEKLRVHHRAEAVARARRSGAPHPGPLPGGI